MPCPLHRGTATLGDASGIVILGAAKGLDFFLCALCVSAVNYFLRWRRVEDFAGGVRLP
jgi:hypothetical protein